MESLIKRFFEHLDLNHDGVPDIKEAEALLNKVMPPLKKFLANGGLEAIKKLIAAELSPSALTALEELITLVPKV